MKLRQVLSFILYLVFSSCCLAGGERNPYDVLGISRSATQDEIRRQYRKLCLKYHPDKNVHRRERDREKCEEQFKRIQHANAQIGDEDSRRRYDQMASSPFGSSNSPFGSTPGGMDQAAAEAFYRSFMQQQQQGSRRGAFYVNGVDISQLFSGGSPFSKPAFWSSQLKSIYICKVPVPLQDLYSGRSNVELVLKDNLWKRYRAAIRGGIAKTILFQGILFSIPILRVSIPLSIIVTACLVHSNIPRPSKVLYDVNIQKGWKSGTKLTFKELEPGFDVVFILEERKHARYRRVGNDLHTSITIRKKQAKEGCVAEIEPLGEYDPPISLRLRPNQIKHSGQQVTLKGKGWPRRKGGGNGDLVVTVNVQSSYGRSRRKRSTTR